MTTIERHKELLKQSLEMLDEALARGVASNPRAVGFAVSSGSVDLLSILLHKLGKISIGKIIEYQWFKKPSKEQRKEPIYEAKLGVEFPGKKEIYALLCEIEEKRTILAYGNPSRNDIESIIENFKVLKKIVDKEVGEEL